MDSEASEPPLPIPDPLRGSETGSFAHRSVAVRLPTIARRILTENDYPPDIRSNITALIQEIPDRPVRGIKDPEAPDTADWERYCRPYLGQDWLQVPWFFAEGYFYRRMLEATGYFKAGFGKSRDPFAGEKRQGLEASLKAIHALANAVTGRYHSTDSKPEQRALSSLLSAALWGNQVDLSLWPVGSLDQPSANMPDEVDAHLLVDDRLAATSDLLATGSTLERGDILLDNAGFELVGDLCLLDYLLASRALANIHVWVKAHPTFVSDATAADITTTVAFLRDKEDPTTHALGQRLEGYLKDGRMQLRSDYFWTSPLPLWEMPAALREDLARSRLVISKGDANYRRCLGDRHWAFTTPFQEIVSYFPAPLLALRTLKSEVVCGLMPGKAEELYQIDPDWLVDGRWGIIQYYRSKENP